MPLKNTKNNLPDSDLFITRKRKKYKFAKFDEMENCFQASEWVDFKKNPPSVIVEVGAGTGLFSVKMAQNHPENFYVAVDIKSDRLYSGAKMANELKLKNIAFVRSDIWNLSELFPKKNVAEIWITFPDPYANEDQTKLKTSDAKHRLTHSRFLEIYKQLFLAESPAKLHFKTDNWPLFEWSKEQFLQNGWTVTESTNNLHNSNLADDYKIKTTYEERFTAEGLPIYLLTATI
jgi:Predicted S-adenosylmethionine-dependent methyltransferase